MRADGSHLVVHAFGQPARFSLDAVQRLGMWHNANLPGPLRRPSQDRRLFFQPGRLEWAISGGIAGYFPVPQNYPTLCDGISSKFHAVIFNRSCTPVWAPVQTGADAG